MKDLNNTKTARRSSDNSTPVTPEEQMVKLANGKEALNLMPELTGPAALVDLRTIVRLAAMLPKASIGNIIKDMRDKLDNLGFNENITDDAKLRAYTQLLEEELTFHKTINLISMVYVPEPNEPQLEYQQ